LDVKYDVKMLGFALFVRGVQFALHVGVLALFVAGLVTPYIISSDDMTISLWQVCDIPHQAPGCTDAAVYFGCPTHVSRVKATRAFGIMVVLMSAISLISHLVLNCNGSGIGAALISTVLVQLCTVCAFAFSVIAMAVDVSLFTEPVCDGKPAAADTAGFRMGPGPKLMIAGCVLAFVNGVCGICHSASNAIETASCLMYEKEDDRP
jgi:hypothetical protein